MIRFSVSLSRLVSVSVSVSVSLECSFAQLTWGRGPVLGYSDAPSDLVDLCRNVQLLRAHAAHAFPPRPDSEQKVARQTNGTAVEAGSQPQLTAVVVPRFYGRASQFNLAALYQACRELGIVCQPCCTPWARTAEGLQTTLDRFRNADLVIGPHGAGLIHMLYARRGAVLLDFWDAMNAKQWGAVFSRYAVANHGVLVGATVKRRSELLWDLSARHFREALSCAVAHLPGENPHARRLKLSSSVCNSPFISCSHGASCSQTYIQSQFDQAFAGEEPR
jgi:hypothetical protein